MVKKIQESSSRETADLKIYKITYKDTEGNVKTVTLSGTDFIRDISQQFKNEFPGCTALSAKLVNKSSDLSKYESWTDVYDEFNKIIEETPIDQLDTIAAKVDALYAEHKGEDVWDLAYKKWLEGAEEDEALDENLIIKPQAKRIKMAEAIDYEDPTALGRGCCAPLVADHTSMINRYVKTIAETDNEDYREDTIKRLHSLQKDIQDNRQSVENFNKYWLARYDACIDSCDNQLELISKALKEEKGEE